MSEMLATFNGLVRDSFNAQEAFDQWDEGATFDCVGRMRFVDLDTVVREWDEANSALIAFVLANGAALAIEARRAIDSEAGVVGDESAGPKDNAHE